jgi:hypothetical protein
MVGRSRQVERNGMKIQPTEGIVMIAIVIALIFAARWYFLIRPKTASYALESYFGYVKKGNVEAQYAMIDASDKQRFFPTQSAYDKGAPQSRGYNMRIQSVSMEKEQPDPKNPNVVKIPTVITVRDSSEGKELYQQGTTTVQDNYTLRKNQNGEWKIWLEKSKRELMNKVKPSEQSTY